MRVSCLECGKILRIDQPWPLTDILAKLVGATEILLRQYNYDGHGYEELMACVEGANQLLSELAELRSPPEPP